jgi:protein TonB
VLWLLVSFAPSLDAVRQAASVISVSLIVADPVPHAVAEPSHRAPTPSLPSQMSKQVSADARHAEATVDISAAATATGFSPDAAALPPALPGGVAQQPTQTTAAPAKALPPSFDADYLDNPAPSYPSLSRRAGEAGSVLLQVHVSAEGRAQEVSVSRSSGFPRLDAAALQAVRRWRFVPAQQAGRAVDGWVLVPINFSLKG